MRWVGRVAQAGVVLLLAYVVTFVILRLLPGDPAEVMLAAAGVDPAAITPEQYAALREKFGLDQPAPVQLVTQLLAALRGDLGLSYASGRPVSELIAERAPGTLAIGFGGFLLAAVLGVTIACAATLVRAPFLRRLLRRLPAIGISLPSFWTGLLFVQLFAFTLGWLPPSGSREPGSVVLPALTLAIGSSAVIAQLLLRGLDEAYREGFVNTARMKGLSPLRVLLRHGLPNAAAPTLTMLALILGNLLTGTVVVETLFSRAGLGRLLQDAVLNQDVPVVQGIVLLAAAIFLLLNLLVDLLYPLLDARQRPEPTAAVAA
jgi:peptide/nickel transport system permease protein